MSTISEIPRWPAPPVPPVFAPPVVEPPKKKSHKLIWAGVGGLVTLGVLAAIGAAVGTTTTTSTTSPNSSGSAGSYTISGTLDISSIGMQAAPWGNTSGNGGDGSGCAGAADSDGYFNFQDVTQGDPVTVSDQLGNTIATGALSSGVVTDDVGACEFTFSIPVPSATSYGISVGNREPTEYTLAELQQSGWSIGLLLGGSNPAVGNS